MGRKWIGKMVEFDSASVSGLEIPKATQEYLVKEGLPIGIEGIIFDESLPLLTLFDYGKANRLATREEWRDLYRVGTAGSLEICIRKGTGDVVTMDLGANRMKFVNSSIDKFVAMLAIVYEDERRAMLLEDERASQVLASRTARMLRQVDPDAFIDPDSWWSLEVDELEHGL